MGDQSLESTQRSMKFLLLLLAPAVALADTGYGYAPQIYCRDTNTSVYAQVCVPAFTSKTTPVTLDIKKVVDNDYCYEQIRTVCEETTKVEPMKVTTCKPSGYGQQHYGAGEHQYCHEEYQTQSFKVPLVTEPLEVSVDVAAPQPEQVCVEKEITITEVVCKDIKEEKRFNVAKFEDATTTIDQTEIVLGEPNCNDVTLTLPTQACSKKHY